MSLIRTIGATIIRNRSTIMTVAGVVGVCGAGVLACRATYKEAGDAVKTAKTDIEAIKESGYSSEKEFNKAVKNVYLDAAKTMFRLYAPAIGLGIISVGLIMYGHKTLKKEYLLVGGAYKALTNDYDKYRKKVKTFVGDDKERAISTLKRPPKVVQVEDPQTGEMVDTNEYEYEFEDVPTDRSVFFDETCQPWMERKGNPEELKRFLIELQEEMQKKFDKQGYLLLNDVYKELDVPETYAGSVCGWLKGYSSDKIDFGIFNIKSQSSRRFVNGLEDVILLTFNDGGYISDKI